MSKSIDGAERRTAQRRRTRRRATDESSVEILESMSDGFVAVNREWRYTYVNRAAERNARLRREEMLGRTVWDVFLEFTGSQFESACRRAMDEGVTVHFEEYYAPLDAWFQQTVYPAADGITVYARDITERKRMEAALDEQQRFIRRITDLSPVVLDVFNVVTGSHTYFSSDVANLLGYTADQIAQMEDKYSTLLHPEDVPRLRENIERLKRLTGGEINEFECRVRRGDEWRWVSSRSMVFAHDEQGHVRQVVNATFDITERKQAEEALRRAYAEVEQRVVERTRQLSEINEELRTEITERKRAEALHKELLHRLVLAQEDERGRVAREMHDQLGQQLTALILKLGMLKGGLGEREELRGKFEALEADARQLDRDVNFLVWELRPPALDDLGLQAALTKHTRNWSKHFDIAVKLHVTGMEKDRLTPEVETALYRIAQEALNNIVKHARATNVDIILERRTEEVSLIIEDDGVGFDTEETFGAAGGGLGLTGMRERTALVGGTVEIESRPGDGMTVFVRIPAPKVPNGGGPNE